LPPSNGHAASRRPALSSLGGADSGLWGAIISACKALPAEPHPVEGDVVDDHESHRVLRTEGRILLAMDVVSGIRRIQWFGRAYQPAGPDRLVELFGDAGFTDVTTARLTSGVVAVLGTRH
jgi:hypothetical protein